MAPRKRDLDPTVKRLLAHLKTLRLLRRRLDYSSMGQLSPEAFLSQRLHACEAEVVELINTHIDMTEALEKEKKIRKMLKVLYNITSKIDVALAKLEDATMQMASEIA